MAVCLMALSLAAGAAIPAAAALPPAAAAQASIGAAPPAGAARTLSGGGLLCRLIPRLPMCG